MKIRGLIICAILLLPALVQNLMGQETVGNILSEIGSRLNEIQVDKITYKQSLEIIDEKVGKIRLISVEVNEKGATLKNSFEVYLADIDKNTIIRKPLGKKLFVSMSTNNKQKFIKYLKDDNLELYTETIDLLVDGTETAQFIIDKVKTLIPMVKSNEKAWSNASEALAWLKGNIGEVTVKTGKCSQTFTIGETKEYLVTLVTQTPDTKGATIEEKYEFNVSDLNKNKVMIAVSGSLLSVKAETKAAEKLIRYTKNNVIQNYVSGFDIACSDVDQARTIISALNAASEMVVQKQGEYSNIQMAAEFIKSKTGDYVMDGKTSKRTLEVKTTEGNRVELKLTETDSQGKEILSDYSFYLNDIDPGTIRFKIAGKKVVLSFATVNKVKLIKYIKNNLLQNYSNELDLEYSDVETTREVISAFLYAVNNSAVTPKTWKSVADAMKFIEGMVKGETVVNDKYDLVFTGSASEPYPCNLKVSKTDEKGITAEESFVFYPYLMEPASVHLESSGKTLSVMAVSTGKKSVVKKIKQDVYSYLSEIEIMAFDSRQAREIADALKFICENAKPKAKDWSDLKATLAYIQENVGDLSNKGKEVKQKFELKDNSPCMISFSINTADDKGVTTEYIYEASLSDLNHLMVDYKPVGGNIQINLVCKNKQKLIKVYKNGQQQPFGSDFEIIDDDVDSAKNLVDALISAIKLCEKK